ncbi:MAG TPA: TadE family protein [Actinomycetota bacterium]|nr:TadE family protein [Actinomycetota bacterium]
MCRREHGQATVELALILPVVALVVAALIQSGMVVVDQVRLWHAAREAARAAVVDPAPHVAGTAVKNSGFDKVDVDVSPAPGLRRRGAPLTVSLVYRPRTVPIVGLLFRRLELAAEATMRIERP